MPAETPQIAPIETALIDRRGSLLVAGLIRAGQLDDLILLPTDSTLAPGAVVVGRVSRIAAGMDAAFLDIGTPQHALLRARDLDRSIGDPALPLARRLHEGQKLAVKLVHAGYDDKGPRVVARVGASLRAEALAQPAGRVLRADDPMVELARMVGPLGPAGIVVADTVTRLQVTKAWTDAGMNAPEIAVDPDGRPLARFDALGTIDQALSPEVPLGDGGRLTVDHTRALTVIDVDSGANVRDVDDFNGRAAAEIARQLRIRNIAGVIVIDFIDGRMPERHAPLVTALRMATANDRAGCGLAGFGPLGLFEMTRKRAGSPLAQTWPAAIEAATSRTP